MVLNDAFMRSWQPAINNLYKQYGAPYGNSAPPPDGALADAKLGFQQRQKNYNSYMNQLAHPKLGYQDAVDYFNSNPDILNNIKNKGAYSVVEGIRNDPTQQEAIKKQGYNINDYINALYNASSGGKFASERAYNQYAKGIKSATKNASNPIQYTQADQNAITSAVQGKKTNAVMASATPNAQQNHPGLLGWLGQDLQRGYDRLIVKPTHAVEGAVNNFLSQEKAHIDEAKKTGTSKGGIGVNLGEILNAGKQGWNGTNNGASGANILNTVGIHNKTAQSLGGGALDFTMNPLNLVPYVAADKLLGEGGLKVGSKLASELAPKFGNTISNTVGKGLQGMASGALGASADASLNPHLTPQERLAELLQMSALGGIGGGLHGALEGGAHAISSRFGALDNLLQHAPLQSDAHTTPQDFLHATGEKALPAPSLYGNTKLPANNEQLQSVEKALQELHNTYQSKLNDHVTNGSGQIDQAIKDLQDQYKQAHDAHVEQGMNAYLAKDSTRNAYADLAKEYKSVKDMFPNGIHIPDHLKSDYADQLPKAFKEVQQSTKKVMQPQTFNLPKELKGAKPRYGAGAHGLFNINFNNDLEKAIYTVTNKGKSLAHNSYLDELKKQTNLTDAQIAQYGKDIRDHLRQQAPHSESDTLTVPSLVKLEPKVTKVKMAGGASSDLASAAEQLGHPSVDDFVQHLQNLDAAHKAVKMSKQADLGHSTANQAEQALQQEFHQTPHAQAMRNSLEYLLKAKPQALEDLKNGFHQTPDAQAIQQSIDHLNQAKANMGEQPGGVMRNDKPLSYVGKNDKPVAEQYKQVDPNSAEQLASLAGLKAKEMPKEPPVSNEPKAINIDQAPQPVKLSPKELQREANMEQFAANDANPHEPNIDNHIISKSDIPKPKVDHGEKFISDAVDNLHKLNGFDNAVVDASGKELKASDSTYKQGLNSRSADVTTEQMVKHEMVTPKGKVVVDKNGKAVGSLKDIIGKMKPKEFKAFNKYLVLKHAITRMERGEKVYPDSAKMGPKKSAAMVSKMEEQLPHFKELSNQVYKWNRALLKNWLVDGGIISKEDFKKFVQANPHYVPMHRVFDPLEAHMGKNAKKGYVNQSNPVKEATGSQRQIIDPIESMIEHANQYVKTVRRNEVGQAVVKALSSNPEALKGWAEIVPTEKGSHALGDALASKAGELKNEEDIQNFLEQFNSAFDKKSDLTKGNIVRVLVNGKPVHLKVNDPAFLDALTNIGPAELPKWIKTVGAVTRSFKVLTTGTNPIFMARNMTRDIPMAYANSTTLSKGLKGQAQFAKDLLNAYWDVATNKQSLQDFKNMGGGHASSVASDTNQLAKTKQDLLPMKSISDLKDQGKNFATARFTYDALKRAHEKVIGGLEKVSNTVETAPRLAEYKRTVKQGGGTYDSKVQGIYNANDVTVNFNRYGTQAKQLDQLVPYLNASIQGIDKFVRAAKDNPAQFVSRLGVGVGLPTALIYLANANDPNYQQLPKYLKDQYFMVPRGDGTFIKIAKPREIGAVTDGIERTLDALKGDPHAFQDYGKTLMSNFLPPVQTIDAPLQQVNANKSFTGAPIVSKALQTMDPVHQYDSKDTGFAKNAAKVTNLIPLLPDQYKSPKNIDYLLKSYGGGLAQMLTAPKQAVSSSFTADPVYSNDISTNFYNEQAKLDQARQVLKKKGIQDSALNEPLRQQFDAQARKISKIRKTMNTTTDPKQKRLYQQMINQMESQMNALVK